MSDNITVKNTTRDLSLGGVKILKSPISKALGLMFRSKGRVLMIFSHQGIYGIWMLFMRFSIDIAFIDRERKIIDLKRNTPPISLKTSSWRIYKPNKPCKYILETEANALENFEVTDQLTF